MDVEKAKELAILESEKYAHQNGFGKEKGKIQTAFLAGFELAFKNNVDLDSVVGRSEQLADHKCKPMVNADWTYLRCECGKRFEPKG